MLIVEDQKFRRILLEEPNRVGKKIPVTVLRRQNTVIEAQFSLSRPPYPDVEITRSRPHLIAEGKGLRFAEKRHPVCAAVVGAGHDDVGDGHVVVYHAHPAAEQRGVIVPAVRTAVDALLPGKDGLQQIARGKNARKTCRCNGKQYKNNQSPDGAPYPHTYIYSIA